MVAAYLAATAAASGSKHFAAAAKWIASLGSGRRRSLDDGTSLA
jgi:hypothetical protein